MKRMVLIPEEKLLQYEQQKGGVSRDNVKDWTQHGWGEKEEERELSDDVIVRGIPKTMKTRAIALLERLKVRPDVISWDDTGQVKIDGVFIPKSNISDLISSAMRSRKHFDPVASQEFFNVLNNINVPKNLVRNEEGWKKVTQKGKGNVMTGLNALFGRGKRKRNATQGQKGGFGGNSKDKLIGNPLGNPYLHEWYGIKKKRKKPQRGSGELHKIPNWVCYKG